MPSPFESSVFGKGVANRENHYSLLPIRYSHRKAIRYAERMWQ